MAEAPFLHPINIAFCQNDKFGIVGELIQIEPTPKRRFTLRIAYDDDNSVICILPMMQFIPQKLELLLKTRHGLCRETCRRLNDHIRHGLSHEGQYDFCCIPRLTDEAPPRRKPFLILR